MKIAIEGCAHGELENIYDTIGFIEQQENIKVDLLLCCGDFQATRNMNDLLCMAIPKKFHNICTFYKYYSGEKVAPILTIFIGGNHEASNYMQELPYGGWVAPNIYYMGYAGVVNINGIRIGGISGIYKGYNYYKGHFEFPPYDTNTIRSVYHTRQSDVYRMKQLSGKMDIILSHDWPQGSYNFGNVEQLMKFKPHFRDEINANKLGSPALEDLLRNLQPEYWFAAHLHCKFSSIIPHDDNKTTKFLALDKCLPKRRFLQLLDIETTNDSNDISLSYDEEWLTILNLTNHLINAKNTMSYMPNSDSPYRWNFTPTDTERQDIRKKFPNLVIPQNFCRTAEIHNDKLQQTSQSSQQPIAHINPQTKTFCDNLQIDDPLSLAMLLSGHELNDSDIFPDISLSSSQMDDSITSNCSESENLSKSLLVLPPPKSIVQLDSNPDEVDIVDEDDHADELLLSNDSLVINDTLSTTIDYDKSSSGTNTISANFADLLNSSTNSPEQNKSVSKFKRRNVAIYMPTDNVD